MKIYKDITIVLVSFKSKNKIKSFVKKITKYFKIIIVENSLDYELKDFFKKNKNIKIYLKDNIGYGSAANFARSRVSTKYFLLCNPDLENINSHSLENFYIIAEKLYPNFLSLGPSFNSNKMNSSFNYIRKDKISGACMFFCSISFDIFFLSPILTKSPYWPFFKISFGPDLQFVEIIGILNIPASTKTFPKPS